MLSYDGPTVTMVSNEDVVRTLERIAGLLEIKGGDNAFKARAYRQAAVQVENLSRQLAEIVASGDDLREITGFGPAIAQKVGELVSGGRLAYLEALEAEIPPSLLEICTIAGIGPRTAATLWQEAGITTLDELEAAARGGGLGRLPRMGAKTVANVLAAVEKRRAEGEKRRRPRDEIAELAETLAATLRTVPSVDRAEIAGSYRRGRPTIGDLDLLAATAEPVAVLTAFAALPQVESVLLRGQTKCSITTGGLQVDCRAVAPDEFGAAWQYFTGSQAHNIRLRGIALRKGLTLNEYGVFRVDDGERIAGATEEEVYGVLGLRWIAPDEREDRGEIDAARIAAAEPVEATA
ncbi:MAG TPA: helix-hairpin-helix domain-containing protein [Candidatus Dormibacteraeota bacterium]|nr:helix-hairpin-helix domain-containing protein [Candidatus Dormibacteraeota bacterium]